MKKYFYVAMFCFLATTLPVSVEFVRAADIQTITIQPGPIEGKDTFYGTSFVANGLPNANYVYSGGWGDFYYDYFEFDLSSIPSGSKIINSTFNLYQYFGNNPNNGKLERITQSWTESGLTRFNNPTAVDFGMTYQAYPVSTGWWEVDITSLTQNWIDGVYPNYGLKLSAQFNSNNHAHGFRTSDELNEAQRPKLIIEYELPEEERKFPLYTQIVSSHPSEAETAEWADDILAEGRAGNYCRTIAQCGCTITSLVMLGRAYGITEGIDGSDVNPGNLNKWMIENNAYNPAGLVDFSQAIKYFGVEEDGVQKSFLKWNGKWLTGAEVKERVSAGEPVISSMVAFNRNGTKIPTHFVLVTKLLSEGSYGVNDPLWYNTANLDDDKLRASYVQDYDNKISNGRDITLLDDPEAVTKSFSASLVGKGQSALLAARSFSTSLALIENEVPLQTAPASLVLETESGDSIGEYTNEPFLSDPFADDYQAPIDIVKSVYASDLNPESYFVNVTGAGDGVYEFSGLVHDSNGQAHPFSFTQSTAEGMIDVYQFNISTGEITEVALTNQAVDEIIENSISDETLNKFFKLWFGKVFAEIDAGKDDQARQHIETIRTLIKAKKMENSPLPLILSKLENQL